MATTKEYIKRIQAKPKIQTAIRTGITKTTIKDIQNANEQTITKAKQELLEPLIIDKGIRDLMVQDQNFNKLKNRLTYEITGVGNEGKETLKTEKQNQKYKADRDWETIGSRTCLISSLNSSY